MLLKSVKTLFESFFLGKDLQAFHATFVKYILQMFVDLSYEKNEMAVMFLPIW